MIKAIKKQGLILSLENFGKKVQLLPKFEVKRKLSEFSKFLILGRVQNQKF